MEENNRGDRIRGVDRKEEGKRLQIVE